MNNAIATVAFLQGQAWAKAADGSLRPLSIDSVLNEGETIVTAPGARVELQFSPGETITLNGGVEVAMSRDLLQSTATTEDEAKLDDASVQQALTVLNQGGDLLDNLEETAAGNTGAGTAGNEGHSFVELSRVLETTGNQTYQFDPSNVNGPQPLVTSGQNPTNQPPEVTDQSLALDEDQVLLGQVIASDLEGEALTYSLAAGPANGTLSLDPVTGQFVYTPNVDYNGPDSFSVNVTDGHDNTSVSQIAIAVIPVNDAPVTRDLQLTTNEDTSVSSQVVAGDVDGDTLSYSLSTNPANGSVSLNPATGEFTYTPTANFNGDDSFVVTVSDGQGGVVTSRVAIGVIPVNDAPVSADQNLTTDEDVSISGKIVASDLDGDSLSYLVTDQPNHGTLVFSRGSGAFSYTPAQDYNGLDSFVVTISDGNGGTTTSTINIVVNPVNDAPVSADQNLTTDEDVAKTGTVVATDVDGDTLSYAVTGAATHGSVSLNATTGEFTYTPTANYNGNDSFVVTISDGKGGISTSTINMTVNPVNDAPVSADQNIVTDEDVAKIGNVIASDIDGDTLSYAVSSASSHGVVSLNADSGEFTYIPNANFSGNDSFVVTISDGNGGTTTSTIKILVIPANDAPVAVADSISVSEGGTATVLVGGATSVLANDSDAESDPLTAALVSGPAHGTLTLNADGTFSYTHDGSETTADSFSYRANDGTVDGNVVTVNIAVTPVNDAPVANTDNASVNEGDAVVINLASNDTDADNALDLTSIQIVSGPANGSVSVNADGTVSYTHNGSQTTADSFTYTIKDASGAVSNEATVNLSVNAVNNAPVAVADSISVSEGGTATVLVGGAASVLANDSDAESDPLTAALVTGPAHGALTLNADGTFSYTHDGSETTADSFSYRANDGTVDGNVVTVNIAVSPVNDAPVAYDGAYSGNKGNSGVHVALTATDIDGTVAGVKVTNLPPAADGFLYLSDGTTKVTTAMTLTVAQAADLIFVPKANFVGAASIVFEAIDDLGAHSSTATVNVNISGNTAPVAVNDPQTSAYSVNIGNTSTDNWTNLSSKGVSMAFYNANGTLGSSYERASDHALGVDGSPRTDTNKVTQQIEYDQTSGTSESIGITFNTGVINHATFGVSNLFPGENGGEVGFWQASYNGVVVASDTFQLSGSSDKGTFTIDTGSVVFDSIRFYALNTYNGTGDGGDYFITNFQGTGIAKSADSYVVNESGTLTISSASSSRLISNDTDADSDSLTVTQINGAAVSDGQSVTLASGSTLVIHSDGSFSYSAGSGFDYLKQGQVASDSFTYTISDGHGGTSTATASIAVIGAGAGLSTVGTSGNDTLVGTADAELMIGGSGADSFSGSLGADTFKWSLGDQGSAGSPVVDTISDFSKAQGDKLDVADLLQGENASNLTNYLHFTYDSTKMSTTVHISSDGGYSGGYTASATDQQILLNGINLVNSNSDADIITQLKAAGYLITN